MPSQFSGRNRQLDGNGAWHSSHHLAPIIYIVSVPLLICMSFQVLLCAIPVPDFLPSIHYSFSAYLTLDLDFAAIHSVLYLVYYFNLRPIVTALVYAPHMVLSLLTATAYARSADNITPAAILHALSWLLQFVAQAIAEKRAPAVLDTLVLGAVALLPFLTNPHLLDKLGYRPRMYKELH
ncbi:hypothetical protein C8R43DRAFT_909185 [Mycena crocata]|nr:hypothetical protein C8R43DRAFT_909185 [Mycena crocata]